MSINSLFFKPSNWTYEWDDGTLEVRNLRREKREYQFTWITGEKRFEWIVKKLPKINALIARKELNKRKPILILDAFCEQTMGFMAEARMTKGQSRWTSNFTAPSFPVVK